MKQTMKTMPIVFAAALVLALAGCGSGGSASSSSATESGSASAVKTDSAAQDVLKERIGTYTYSADVRNDKTGRWRELVYHSAERAQDIAVDYWEAYGGSDDEIHALINLGLKTTSRVSKFADTLLVVTVHEYVDGEEHDATEMFTGPTLEEFIVDMESGEVSTSEDYLASK